MKMHIKQQTKKVFLYLCGILKIVALQEISVVFLAMLPLRYLRSEQTSEREKWSNIKQKYHIGLKCIFTHVDCVVRVKNRCCFNGYLFSGSFRMRFFINNCDALNNSPYAKLLSTIAIVCAAIGWSQRIALCACNLNVPALTVPF